MVLSRSSVVTLMRMREEAATMFTYGDLDRKLASYYIHFFFSFPSHFIRKIKQNLCTGHIGVRARGSLGQFQGATAGRSCSAPLGGEGRGAAGNWPGGLGRRAGLWAPLSPPLAGLWWPPASLFQRESSLVRPVTALVGLGAEVCVVCTRMSSRAPRGGGLCSQHTARGPCTAGI